MARTLVVLGVLICDLSCYHSIEVPPQRAPDRVSLRVTFEPPTVLNENPSAIVAHEIDVFLASDSRMRTTERYTPLHIRPADAGSNAIAGDSLILGARSAAWVITRSHGLKIYIDDDFDGDLTNNRGWPFTRYSNGWQADVNVRGVSAHGELLEIALRLWVEDSSPITLVVAQANVRGGHVRLGARDVSLRITGIGGVYGLDSAPFCVDVNNDGKFDDVDECWQNAEGAFEIDGLSYPFEVNETGATVTVGAASKARRPRQSVAVGARVPRFRAVTIKGKVISDERIRDKTVLLDFWSMSCAPCADDLPRIIDLRSKMPDLMVISITTDEGRGVERYAQDHGMDWPMVQEVLHDSALHTLFRISGVPRYYLLKNGTIACSACSLDQVLERLP